MKEIETFLGELFIGEGIIVAVAAYVVGEIIKKALKFVPNEVIPLICGLLGVGLGLVLVDLSIIGAVKGLCLGWAATGGYEAVKSLKNKTDNDV